MSDEVAMRALGLAALVFQGLFAYMMARIHGAQGRTTAKVDDLMTMAEDTRGLVADILREQHGAIAGARRRIADLTGDPDDLALADLVEAHSGDPAMMRRLVAAATRAAVAEAAAAGGLENRNVP